MQDLSDFHDVVIAGAGPVGLFLACELRLGGCSVLVLERERDPHPPLKQLPLGRRGLSVLTIESFDRRGLLKQLGEHTTPLAQHETPHWSVWSPPVMWKESGPPVPLRVCPRSHA